MKKIIKPEIMWAIHGKYGFYTGTYFLRKDAIKHHTEKIEKSWQQCKKGGDVAVKVIIKAVQQTHESDSPSATVGGSEEKQTDVPEKLKIFMYALMKEAQRFSFVEFCENWDIDFDTDYREIERWFKQFGIDL